MIDHQRHAQWQANSRLAVFALVLVALFFIVLPVIGPQFNDSYVLRFPLGYLLATLGSIVGLVGLIYWIAARQDRLDARYNLSGDY